VKKMNDFWFRTGRERHTGEWLWVEPLRSFLRRKIRVKPDNEVPNAPKRQGYQG
jgi:hypothetical protein